MTSDPTVTWPDLSETLDALRGAATNLGGSLERDNDDASWLLVWPGGRVRLHQTDEDAFPLQVEGTQEGGNPLLPACADVRTMQELLLPSDGEAVVAGSVLHSLAGYRVVGLDGNKATRAVLEPQTVFGWSHQPTRIELWWPAAVSKSLLPTCRLQIHHPVRECTGECAETRKRALAGVVAEMVGLGKASFSAREGLLLYLECVAWAGLTATHLAVTLDLITETYRSLAPVVEALATSDLLADIYLTSRNLRPKGGQE